MSGPVRLCVLIVFVLVTIGLYGNSALAAQNQAREASDEQVMQAFASQDVDVGAAVEISKKDKHSILFFMGITLLLLILATAVLGVAMGVYGKPVFVYHMVLAGLSATLALAHSVVAIVWFYPF